MYGQNTKVVHIMGVQAIKKNTRYGQERRKKGLIFSVFRVNMYITRGAERDKLYKVYKIVKNSRNGYKLAGNKVVLNQ